MNTSTPTETPGWIEWNGGECPVDGGQMVEVKFGPRDTQTGRARWFDGGISHKPSGWKQDGPHESWIIAYRIVEPGK
jgi:hypothetical protein